MVICNNLLFLINFIKKLVCLWKFCNFSDLCQDTDDSVILISAYIEELSICYLNIILPITIIYCCYLK